MTKTKRRVLIGIGSVFGLFLVLAAALVIFIATLDQSKLKNYISSTVSTATGRQFVINGDLKFDFGWVTKVSASGLQLQNVDWSKHPQMAEVGLFDVEVDLWQMIRHFRVVIPSITISESKVILEKKPDGAANWEFRTPVTEPVTPRKRTEFPVIQKIVVKRGTLLYDDQASKTQVDLKVIDGEGAGFLDAPVKLKAEGTYQKLPLRIDFNGGSYENLRSSKQPYPLQINLDVGNLKARINGNMIEPLEMKGEDVTLDVQGDDMANLYPLIRLVFPKTPPYRLKGHLKHDGKVWSFSNFSGRVGDSDLSGTIQVDTAPERPFMKANLVSNVLDFDDLAGFVGGNPTSGPRTASKDQKQPPAADKKKQAAADQKKQAQAVADKDSDRLFPDQEYDLDKLRSMDADVRLRGKKILAPNLPIDDLNAALTLKNGVLSFTPATFGVANGRMEIYSTFDGSKRPSKVKIDARMRQLDLKRFLGNSEFAQKTLTPISGRINLTGTGQSFRELMATASGSSFVAMSGGEISAKLIELAGLDVAESLGYLIKGDKPIPVRCGLLDIRGENGQMGVQTLVFDTTDTVISGEGNIDLRDENANLVILPVPKDFSPLSLRSYIRVQGRFKDLSIFPDPIKTGTNSLVKKIFNAVLLLIMTPFQPRDLAQGKDVDCNALIAKIQDQDPQGIVLKDVQKPAAATANQGDREAAQRHASQKR